LLELVTVFPTIRGPTAPERRANRRWIGVMRLAIAIVVGAVIAVAAAEILITVMT
jgi:hypothetical protein